jgi:hypothetical protein
MDEMTVKDRIRVESNTRDLVRVAEMAKKEN